MQTSQSAWAKGTMAQKSGTTSTGTIDALIALLLVYG
jgi:hypothetical protein